MLTWGRTHFASKSATAELIYDVEADGVPPHFSKTCQYETRNMFANKMTPYGLLVKSCIVAHVTVAVQNPPAVLHYCADTCA